jgi:hypothetical protein
LRVLFATALIGTAPAAKAQEAAPPLDGRERVMQDSLLDHLAGEWRVERTMRGRTTGSVAHGEWVLNHQFLLLHYRDDPRATTPSGYEAMAFIGYDNASERYVVHWIDVFGGRVSAFQVTRVTLVIEGTCDHRLADRRPSRKIGRSNAKRVSCPA